MLPALIPLSVRSGCSDRTVFRWEPAHAEDAADAPILTDHAGIRTGSGRRWRLTGFWSVTSAPDPVSVTITATGL